MSDLHTMTGAYAAGALDEAENAAFADHLLTCAACGQILVAPIQASPAGGRSH